MGNRNDVVKLPGKIILDATGGSPVHVYSNLDITAELGEEVQLQTSQIGGTYGQAVTGRMVQIKITPTGFTAAALAALFPHLSVRMGGSIVGVADKALDLCTIDGKRRRIACAFIYGMPALNARTGQTILGEVTIYGIVPLNGTPAALASFWAAANEAWDVSTFDKSHNKTPSWDIGWSAGEASAWDALETDGGMTITPTSTIDDDRSDRLGMFNATIRDLQVAAKAKVKNIREELLMAAIGWDLPLGADRSSLGRVLKLNAVGGGAYIRVYGAVLQPPYGLTYGAGDTVVRDLNWLSFPDMPSGVMGPRMLVTTEDPDAEE